MRVVILPGMGCSPVRKSNWYQWLSETLEKQSIECVLRDFPEPNRCRQSVWMPFLENEIGITPDTVLVGHSTGADCAMRFLEQHSSKQGRNSNHGQAILGAILVAVAYTDLGDLQERASEYFDEPWDWDAVRAGARCIHIFHSTDDHLIPVQEARYVNQQLQNGGGSDDDDDDDDNQEDAAATLVVYHEHTDKSHFFDPFDELLDAIDQIKSLETDNEL